MEAEKGRINKQVRIGGSLILGTPQERAKLLKAGADGKLIEKLYIECNNFKIFRSHVLFDLTNEYQYEQERMSRISKRNIK